MDKVTSFKKNATHFIFHWSFMKKLSKQFSTIFQHLLENSRMFKCLVFGTKAEELKEFVAQFLSLPLPLYQRMKLFPFLLEYLVQRQFWSRWVLCAIQHLISTNMNFRGIAFLMFRVLEPQIPSDKGCKDEWNFRFLRHIGGKIVTSFHLERRDFKEPAESSGWGGFVWIITGSNLLCSLESF